MYRIVFESDMRERGRPKAVLELTEVDREILAGYRRRRKTAQGLAVRSAIVLSCARGLDNNGRCSETECVASNRWEVAVTIHRPWNRWIVG